MLVCLLAVAAPGVAASGLVVIDGDTLEIDGRTADLFGIDAPELGQICQHGGDRWNCGERAAFALHKLIEVDDFTCSPWNAGGRQPDDRPTFVCRMRDQDLGEILIQDGYAIAAANGFPSYVSAEADARSAGLGLWRGQFIRPASWRSSHDGLSMMEPCPIKAVHDQAGRRVFYVPTDPGYDDVVLDDSVANRRFCSDEDAIAEGWRHAGAD